MSASFPGRTVALLWNAVALACQEKSVTVNGEPLDVSDDSSAGWRVLDTELGERSVNVSVSGLVKSHTLRHAQGTQATLTYTYPTGQGSFTGTFQLATYNEDGPYKESVKFDAEFQSTGLVTFTPPA